MMHGVVQALMAMPLRPRPAAAALPSTLAEASTVEDGSQKADLQLVSAVAEPATVQPAKQAVYSMFADQVGCMGVRRQSYQELSVH